MTEPQAYIQDLREPDNYGRIPAVLIFDKDAPDSAIRFYGALDRFMNKRTKALFPGYKKIREKTGMGRATISRAIKYLEKNRYLNVLRSHRRVNHYVLMPVKSWVPNLNSRPDRVPKVDSKDDLESRNGTPSKAVSLNHRSFKPASKGTADKAGEIKKLTAQIEDFELTLEKPNLSDRHRADIKRALREREERLSELMERIV